MKTKASVHVASVPNNAARASPFRSGRGPLAMSAGELAPGSPNNETDGSDIFAEIATWAGQK